jgi:hypothetical protein
MTAKSNAANQAAYRARKRASALLEVRGIFARTELHQTIKALARVLAESPPTPHPRTSPHTPASLSTHDATQPAPASETER